MTQLDDVLDSPRSFDVIIVGAGPSGSACAYWLAKAGWSVCLVEKKTFPREKTCGDGLTPRSVHQIQEMGLERDVAAHGHRYNGLRAFGFGASLEMNWPDHPTFPNYGYTILSLIHISMRNVGKVSGKKRCNAPIFRRSCSPFNA